MPAFEISVILAEAPGQPDLLPALASIQRACAGIRTEVLVVRLAGGVPVPPASALSIRELPATEAMLVPERWGVGVRAATAPAFACLTTEFTVHPDWATTLLEALATGAVGAAGAIELATNATATAAATYLVRFSPYLPRAGEPSAVENIPGDTAAYQREAVLAFPDLLAEGFWEVEFHHRFVAEGKRLLAIRRSLATFSPTRGIYATLLLRYRHGTEHGSTRVLRHRHNFWRLLLAAPLVPWLLTARIARRIAAVPGQTALAVRAAPALLLINAAWAAGEARGGWLVRGRR